MQSKKITFTRSFSQPQIFLPREDFYDMINNNKNEKVQNEIDILKIINQALNVETAKKNYSQNNFYTRNDLLIKTKENSVLNFLNNLQNKNISHLKDTFFSKINENATNTLLKISEYKNLAKNNMNKYDYILDENKKISKEISNMTNEQRQLGLDLRKSQNLISQMQIKDQNLKQYKSLYDEFLKAYPGKDPVNQMKELKINKNIFLNKFNEYNDLQRKLEIETKDNQRRLDQEKRYLKHVIEKYNRISESNNMKIMENKMILEELNTEKRTLQKLKEDNNKYRKMLFNLYTKLLGAFKLNKKIIIDEKFLKLTENDFYPDIMDDMRLFDYIKLMVNNIDPSERDRALKQTIAYSNMITRIYLKNKSSLRYDPLNIFKELKTIMEEKEQKIIKLSDKVKDFEIKINNMELENKKLNNLLIHFNQERIKNMSNKSFLRAQRARRRSTTLYLKKNNNTAININKNFTNLKRPKTGINRYTSNILLKKNEDIKRNNSLNINMKEKNNEKEYDKEEFININKFNNEEIKFRINSARRNNDIIKLAKKKWSSDGVQMREFKKIKESRNKDKILKIHNQQPLVKCLNEFNRLIKHTNKLFVYKYKISPKDLKNNHIQNMTSRYLAERRIKKSKSMEEIKNNNKTDIKIEKEKEKENELSQNIEKKIDDLIKTLQGKNLLYNNKSNTNKNQES